METALLIEWDPSTGIRAGGIKIGNKPDSDKTLFCKSWQNMDVTPALEIRLITDGRNLSQYENVPGVTILRGKQEINNAIDMVCPPKLVVSDQFLFEQHIKDKVKNGKLDLDKLKGGTLNDNLTDLKAKGVKGITEHKPIKL